MTIKEYLEQHQDWKAITVSARTATVEYMFVNKKTNKKLTLEYKPDTSIVVVYNNNRKVIPSKQQMSVAYGHKVTDDDVLRLFDMVLVKLEETDKTDADNAIEREMDKFSRGHL